MRTEMDLKSWYRLVWLALPAAIYVLAGNAGIAAGGEQIGRPLPSGTQTPPPSAQTTASAPPEWQSATVGLSGNRIAEILSKASLNQKTITTRGRKEVSLYRKAAPSVVLVITSDDGLGSGSYIGSNLIITNWHVVKDFAEVGVFFKPSQGGTKAGIVRAKVMKVDPIRDLALLKVAVAPKSAAPLKLGSNVAIQVGADVHAIGHPTGETWTYTRGIVSQIRPDYEWQGESPPRHRATIIQTQTPINPGNSGGPLLDDSGQIIGMNSFIKSGTQGLAYAVSVDDISAFLKSPSRQTPSQKNFTDRLCKQKKLYEGRDQENTGALIQFDTNCDAKADASLFIPDDESKPRQALLDSNFDGKIDIIVEDQSRDGKWDISFHDVDFDGLADLVGSHPDGKLAASRYEKYAG
jgi:S1-C subfamily serine protease